MSQDTIALELQERTVVGKGLNDLRKGGLIPAVVHDHGKPSMHVMADAILVNKTFQQAGKHHPVEITVGKEQRLALIKNVDIDPVKHRMRHVVFQAIRQDEKTQTEVPIVITGDIPAEKTGLMMIRQLEHISIEALPKDLIDEITIDGSTLVEIGDKLTVADLQVPSTITILTEVEHPIATIEETKAQISEEEEAEAAEGEGEEGAEESAEGEAKEKESGEEE